MTAKLYVRRGGNTAVDTEYTQLNPSLRKGAPIFDHNDPLIQLGMRCEMGEASQGYFKVMDPDAEVPTSTFRFPPHALVTLTEDASGDELWLARGRVAPLESGRGDTKVDNEIEHDITVNDGNMDLRGIPFTEDWVRPAETGRARVGALALYILNGASSTAPDISGSDPGFRVTTDITVIAPAGGHLAPQTNEVNMPKKTYPSGTQPQDVIDDCATVEGKIYAVVIHHTGGTSHLCLLYTVRDDHSTFATAVKISQDPDDWDPTDPTAPVFEPIYDQGKASVWDHDAVATVLVSRWGGTDDEPRTVIASRPSLIDDYEYWGESYDDGESKTETQAEDRANAILDGRSPSELTNRVSILVSASQTYLLCAGMSIQVKGAPMASGPALGSYTTRRIAQLTWEPVPDGRYWAHMQLGRGLRRKPPSHGGGQPKSTTPKPAPEPEPSTGDTNVIDWDWSPCADPSYTDSYDASTGNPWGSGYAAAGWTTPLCSSKTNYNAYSKKFAVSPGDELHVVTYMARYGSPSSTMNFAVRFYDSGGSVIGNVNNTLPIGYLSNNGGQHGVFLQGSCDVTVPVGAAHAALAQTTWSLAFTQHVIVTIPGVVVADDPEAIDYGDFPHDSTAYLPADYVEARLDHLQDQISDLPDEIQDSLTWKEPVRVATTANGTLATAFENGDTVDGVTLATGDRILLKDQTTGADRGIYTVNASGAPTRATDMDADADVLGAVILVTEGTANADKVYVCTTNAPITLGTTSLTFTALSGGGGSGHAITEDAGSPFTTRANLDFRHGLDVTDDAGTTSTRVAVDETELDHATIGGTSPDIPKSILAAKGDLIGASANDTPSLIAAGSEGMVPVQRAAATPGTAFEYRYSAINLIIGDGQSVIATGVKAYLRVPFACTIVGVSLGADVTGDLVVDIWKDSHASYPPVDGDSITGGNEPELTADLTYDDTTLTSWTTAIAAGDWLAFNVDSAATVEQVTVYLRLRLD